MRAFLVSHCQRLLYFFAVCYLDVDECITGNHNCDVNANCSNTVGGHNSTCKEAFAGDGPSCSSKLDIRINLKKAVIIVNLLLNICSILYQ